MTTRSRNVVGVLTALVCGGVLAAACSTGTTTQPQPPAPSTTQLPTPTFTPAPSAAAPDTATLAPVTSSTASAPVLTTTVPATPQATVVQVPGIGLVDRSSPDTVALAALRTWYTTDTATDSSATEAALRSRPLLDAGLYTQLHANAGAQSTSQWRQWTQLHVTTTAAVRLVQEGLNPPHDTATTAYRVVQVTQTPTTGAGQLLPPIERAAYTALSKQPGGWVVSQVSQR